MYTLPTTNFSLIVNPTLIVIKNLCVINALRKLSFFFSFPFHFFFFLLFYSFHHRSSPYQLFFSLGPVGPSSPDNSTGSFLNTLPTVTPTVLGNRLANLSISSLESYTIFGPHSLIYCSHGGSSTTAPRYSAATIWYLELESTERSLHPVSFLIPIPSVVDPCK